MHYPVGYNRSLMIILLVAYIIRVAGAPPLEKRESPEPPPPGTSSTPQFWLLETAQRTAEALARDTAQVSNKVWWSFGKLLLSAGESVNYLWDAALNVSVQLLKAGGAACGSIAERLANVPVIGYGASGVHQVVDVAVNAVASNVAHDSMVRSQAYAVLNGKLNESGARLRPAEVETSVPAPPTTIGRCAPDEASSLAADPPATDTKPTTVAPDSTTATTDPSTAADQSPPTEDGKPSIFSKSKTELYKSLSTLGSGLSLVLKSVGQATLTAIGVLLGTYDSAISVVATTGETVSTGLNLVNNVGKRVILLGDVTGGVYNLASGMSSTLRKNTDNSIANREELFDTLDEKLENHHPELISSTTNEAGVDGKSTDIFTAASAPPTNEGSKAADTTATETAPATTPPV